MGQGTRLHTGSGGTGAEVFARPEAINHYWQALELIERLPHTPELDRVHCNVILSLTGYRAGCGMTRRRRACFAMLMRR